MKLLFIRPSCESNLLNWALKYQSEGELDLSKDTSLQSLINDELSFQVGLGDVNEMELFRLTQTYRDKLRILEDQYITPSDEILSELYPGECSSNDQSSAPIPNKDLAKHVIDNFMNISTQMQADDDIIQPNAVKEFIPMICRRCDIQIPISFKEFCSLITSKDIFHKIFNDDYPNSLDDITGDPTNPIHQMIMLRASKETAVIRYNESYDKYLETIKYFPINNQNADNKIYHLALLGFSKYDRVNRSDVSVSFFNPDPDKIKSLLRKLLGLRAPINAQFVVQLPISYMQYILNFFPKDLLPVSYESSARSIIASGLVYDDFIMPEINPADTDPEHIQSAKTAEAAISAYKLRIKEADNHTLSAINKFSNNPDITTVDLLALCPCIYNTRAVFTIDSTKFLEYQTISDPLIKQIIEEMFAIITKVSEDISQSK